MRTTKRCCCSQIHGRSTVAPSIVECNPSFAVPPHTVPASAEALYQAGAETRVWLTAMPWLGQARRIRPFLGRQMRSSFPAQGPPEYPGIYHFAAANRIMKPQGFPPPIALRTPPEWLICEARPSRRWSGETVWRGKAFNADVVRGK